MSDKVVGLIRMGGVILLFIIGVILLLGAMATEIDPVTNEAVGDVSAVISSVNFALWMAYASFGAIIAFGIWGIIQNPKKYITTGIGIVVFIIVVLIGYSMASSEPLFNLDTVEIPENTSSNVKWAGAGINTTGILVVIAGALIAVGSVMGIMRYFSKS